MFLNNFLFFFAKRFIAGQTLPEALDVVQTLNQKGFSTTLDHLGENVVSTQGAKKSAEMYVDIFEALKARRFETNVSVKLTEIGLDIDHDQCLQNLKLIAEKAKKVNGFVRVDIEGSNVTSTTFDIVKKLKATTYPIGVATQAMLRRTPSDVVSLMENGVTMRLCKGAYKEPVDIAYQDKRDVDRQYVALMKRLLTSGMYHGIATHDEKIIEETKSFAKQNGITPDKFEFQMLLGIRPKLQQRLLSEGWRVRVYVPFGDAWLPYTYRRLRERKENIWFVAKNLFRG